RPLIACKDCHHAPALSPVFTVVDNAGSNYRGLPVLCRPLPGSAVAPTRPGHSHPDHTTSRAPTRAVVDEVSAAQAELPGQASKAEPMGLHVLPEQHEDLAFVVLDGPG